MTDDSGWTNIAIIGGGISGVSVAYELASRANFQNKMRISIFERKQKTGGNIDTMNVQLGVKAGTGDHVSRLVDLGVNDINATTYENIIRVMGETNYYHKNELEDINTNQALKPLEDSVSFFTLDGTTLYTKDSGLQSGVSDSGRNLDVMLGGKFKNLIEIIDHAALKKIYGTINPKKDQVEIDIETSLENFFEQAFRDDAQLLKAQAKEDCNDKKCCSRYWEPGEIKETLRALDILRDCYYYPRISAMYFANDLGPKSMLLAAPYRYYRLQEGVGAQSEIEAERLYFVKGASDWFHHISSYVQIDLPAKKNVDGEKCLEVDFVRYPVEVVVKKNGFSVMKGPNMLDLPVFDYCIMANHADDAQKALVFEDDVPNCERAVTKGETESTIRKWLSSINYTTSIAVTHTYTSLLPPDVNAWRTYNVCIRPGTGLKTYSMTYVCNRHQNDVKTPKFDHAGHPQVFVTLNPIVPIPDQYVLEKVNAFGESEVINSSGGFNPSNSSLKAADSFKHNLLDYNCFFVQKILRDYHSSKPKLFFTGGWTNGAGLHEECWQQGLTIAKNIVSQIAARAKL